MLGNTTFLCFLLAHLSWTMRGEIHPAALSASTTRRSAVINYNITCIFAKMMENPPREQEKLRASLLLG